MVKHIKINESINLITNLILNMYELHATNFAACNLLGWDWHCQSNFSNKEINLAEKELDKRIQFLETSARSKLLEQYANPVIRKQQSH